MDAVLILCFQQSLHLFAEVIRPDIADHDKGDKPVTKEDAREKSQDIVAFVGCFQLKDTVNDHREHQKDSHPE